MESYPKQIVLGASLAAFVEHCEVYCTAACCGTAAFEVHAALLLRKCIDLNLQNGDGSQVFHRAWQQLRELVALVDSTQLESVHDEVPFWKEEFSDLPVFWLPRSDVGDWLHELEKAFRTASQYGGLDQAPGDP